MILTTDNQTAAFIFLQCYQLHYVIYKTWDILNDSLWTEFKAFRMWFNRSLNGIWIYAPSTTLRMFAFFYFFLFFFADRWPLSITMTVNRCGWVCNEHWKCVAIFVQDLFRFPVMYGNISTTHLTCNYNIVQNTNYFLTLPV